MKTQLFCLALFLQFWTPAPALANSSANPGADTLTVSIFNDAEVPPTVLAEGKARAALVLRRAGLDVSWMDCGMPGSHPSNSGCTDIAFPRHLSLRLVANHGGLTTDTFGQAYQDAQGEGAYVVVYFGVLSASGPAASVHTGNLLGLVIAHELGHLLLGLQSHSASGLMSPVWQADTLHLAARGSLFFTDAQQDRIRSRFRAAVVRLDHLAAPVNIATGR